MPTAATPTIAPSRTYIARAPSPGWPMFGIAKAVLTPTNAIRTAVATAAASATGISEAGRSSNRSSSTASRTAETGLPKVAVMPAAAPAESSVFRSAAVVCRSCPISEPSAPPVAMISLGMAGLVLEQHGRRRSRNPQLPDELRHAAGEVPAVEGGQPVDSADQPLLDDRRSLAGGGPAGRGQRERDLPAIARCARPGQKALVGQPPHHGGDRALVRQRAPGQLTRGERAAGRMELLQDEVLRGGQPGALLRVAGGLADELHDPAQGVEHGGGVVRCMGSHGSSCLGQGSLPRKISGPTAARGLPRRCGTAGATPRRG